MKRLRRVSTILFLLYVFIVLSQNNVKAVVDSCLADINQDGFVDLSDYTIMVQNFLKSPPTNVRADIDGNGVVDLRDYSILVAHFLTACSSSSSPSPTSVLPTSATFTPTKTPTKSPSSTPSHTPTFSPTRTPTIVLSLSPTQASPTPTFVPQTQGVNQGLLISDGELQARPIAGQLGCESGTLCYLAWNDIIKKADSNWGAINLSVYNTVHPPGVLSAAIAARRLSFEPGRSADAQKYRAKAVSGILAIIGTEQAAVPDSSGGGGITDGSLAISRALPSYVLAADILGLYPDGNSQSDGTKIGNYFSMMAVTKFTFRVGDGGATLVQHHDEANSNGNQMAGGARMSLDGYLKDSTDFAKAFLTFRRYTGDRSVGPNTTFNSGAQTWIYSTTAPIGINPANSTCNGSSYPADGVIPNDQGRGGPCPSNVSTAPTYTQYPWEGLQGVFLQALLLDRKGFKDPSGNSPWTTQNSALLRAVKYQWYLQNKFGGSWYDSSRAAWVKHLANIKYGFKPLNYNSSAGGRNMDFTQWLYTQ